MEKQNNKLQRNLYKWHRILGLIALVPIIMWTISGLSHPFMSNWFRPSIAQETYQQPSLSQLKPAMTLPQVLDQNHLTQLINFGLIRLNRQTYYQVLQTDSLYHYYSAVDGKPLFNGDKLYAIQLARYFTQDSVSAIKAITLQQNFDGQYQPINHLLPVWKVSFNRADGMDVYIETGQSRMGTFNNNTRKGLLWLFEQLHTWDFVAHWFGNQFRLLLMICVVGILFLALCSGLIIYGLFWNRFKQIAQNNKSKARKNNRWVNQYHRRLGLVMSLIMLLFFTSAGFHIIVKLYNRQPQQRAYQQLFNRTSLITNNLQLPIADSLIHKQALIKMYDQVYYQITDSKKNLIYFNATDGTLAANKDREYAEYLAFFYQSPNHMEGKHANLPATPVKQFNNEYGFINKRLPVQKVSYPGNDNWYIETGTSSLATHVAGIDRAEGLSFIFLHKFFWMTWAGKNVRDMVSIIATLSVLVVALLGFTAFIKNK